MPAALVYDPKDNNLMDAGEDEWNQRMTAYRTSKENYEGKYPPSLATHKHPKTGVVIDNNVSLNLLGMRVDRRRDFLFGGFPTVELPGGVTRDETTGDETRSADQEWLDAAWEENDGPIFMGNTALVGGLTGHDYVRIMRPESGEEYP